MKKILLTGGSGFVGKNLIEHIEKLYSGKWIDLPRKEYGKISTITRTFKVLEFSMGEEVYNLYAPSSRELNVLDDVTVTEWLTSMYFDEVLHFAVYTNAADDTKDGSKMLEYNLRSFMSFYKCREHYGRMFYSGSGAEFNKEYDIENVSEESLETDEQILIPTDQYGLMKYTIGQLINTSDNIYNLRIFGLFGKYEYSFRFITQMCHDSIAGKELSIRQNVTFDYLYVEDFCWTVMRMLEAKSLGYHSYNVVSGKKINLVEICKLVNEAAIEYRESRLEREDLSEETKDRLMRIVLQPISVSKDGMNNEYTASADRLKSEIPDYEPTLMQQAIDELYAYYADKELGI